MMGTAISRQLSAEDLAQLQKETGFTFHRIDSLYEEYRSLARDSKDRVLRSELLQLPVVAAHPLSERLVDSFLHPSYGFQHFVRGLAHFRRNETLERKLANILSMFDEDGDGQLSVEQCHNLLARLPATRRELRVMHWRLNKLLDEKAAERQDKPMEEPPITITTAIPSPPPPPPTTPPPPPPPTTTTTQRTLSWDKLGAKVNCADFKYITRGLDLEHSLSLRFN